MFDNIKLEDIKASTGDNQNKSQLDRIEYKLKENRWWNRYEHETATLIAAMAFALSLVIIDAAQEGRYVVFLGILITFMLIPLKHFIPKNIRTRLTYKVKKRIRKLKNRPPK